MIGEKVSWCILFACFPASCPPQTPRKKKARSGQAPNSPKLTRMMIKLWEMIVEHKDANGREVSGIFMVLPTRKELPNYYQLIKKPIDLKKIKVRGAVYYHCVHVCVCVCACVCVRACVCAYTLSKCNQIACAQV